jgi:leucyl aminopeptidase
LANVLEQYKALDARTGKECIFLGAPEVPGNRLIHSPTGSLTRYVDDVRRVFDAAHKAATVALNAGAKKPLLLVSLSTSDSKYQNAIQAAYLGMAQALWQPLEAREAREALEEAEIEPISAIGLVGLSDDECQQVYAIELGKRLARDLCGTEPERMAPPAFAQYCVESFEGSPVTTQVIDDLDLMKSEYPLLHAVARASLKIERHQPRIVRMTYEGDGPIEKTLFFVGKGITFDTGGADLKVGGHMAGMSRDKGGAAAVAGFMKSVACLAPKGIKIVADLAVVRNSIGDDAFVPDEIIKGHAGKRVRVGNTDAEGRMVMADVLSHIRELAISQDQSTQPEIFTVATLTGHAAVAFGPYTAYVQNGAAEQTSVAHRLTTSGVLWADNGETSLSRREDYDFIDPSSKADDVLSSNNAPSVSTARGHQFPMAFLAIASGLDKNDIDADISIPYTHVDIAGSGVEKGDWQHGKPTAAPVTAMLAEFVLGRC